MTVFDDLNFPPLWDALDDIAPPCAAQQLIGHAHAQRMMMAAARGAHHALILDGERGIGKATAAFLLANAVLSDLALEADSIPAAIPSSSTWRQVAQIVHPNMLYLSRPPTQDGKGFRQVITVDEIRRINNFLGMSASGAGRRVVIIDPINDMNRNAANALLKLLEEPPAKTLFLLIANGMGGVLPTIRSRCQMIRFNTLGEDETKQVLALSAPGLAEDSRLAALANGSPRHAIEMALHGGLELSEALTALVESPRFDTALAHKLAEAAGARGDATHAKLLRGMIGELIARRARTLAGRGSLSASSRIARLFGELEERAAIADGYNLDRKQEFLVTAARLHEAFHAS